MSIKDRLKSEGLRLAQNPAVAKVAQDPRFFKFVMQAVAMPGKLQSFSAEQRETFAKMMGLATQDEVRDLKRTVAALEDEVARLRRS
jgi:hypothetical protein